MRVRLAEVRSYTHMLRFRLKSRMLTATIPRQGKARDWSNRRHRQRFRVPCRYGRTMSACRDRSPRLDGRPTRRSSRPRTGRMERLGRRQRHPLPCACLPPEFCAMRRSAEPEARRFPPRAESPAERIV
jgi:hypothetical protein